MPRWEPDARTRLEEAALALFSERGFDETKIEDIARRAGLTKRTFFRHFGDKREVLFGGGDIEGLVAAAVRSAPPTAGALEAVSQGLQALAGVLDGQGEAAARRIRIVRASPGLWERQLIKFDALAETIARALRARGVGDPAAILAAQSGIAALRVASDRWIGDIEAQPLGELVTEAVVELQALASPPR
jgi:AcrR family transcriptional regulator